MLVILYSTEHCLAYNGNYITLLIYVWGIVRQYGKQYIWRKMSWKQRMEQKRRRTCYCSGTRVAYTSPTNWTSECTYRSHTLIYHFHLYYCYLEAQYVYTYLHQGSCCLGALMSCTTFFLTLIHKEN